MEGRCQCSLITFTTPLPKPTILYICHCTQCRHQSSSAHGMSAVFPYFPIPEPHAGAIGVYDRPGSNGGQCRGYFCTRCGSRLYHRDVSRDGVWGDTVVVKAGCLVGLDRGMVERAVHIWVKEAVGVVPEGVERFEGNPPENYP